jgi:hypothetical protein
MRTKFIAAVSIPLRLTLQNNFTANHFCPWKACLMSLKMKCTYSVTRESLFDDGWRIIHLNWLRLVLICHRKFVLFINICKYLNVFQEVKGFDACWYLILVSPFAADSPHAFWVLHGWWNNCLTRPSSWSTLRGPLFNSLEKILVPISPMKRILLCSVAFFLFAWVTRRMWFCALSDCLWCGRHPTPSKRWWIELWRQQGSGWLSFFTNENEKGVSMICLICESVLFDACFHELKGQLTARALPEACMQGSGSSKLSTLHDSQASQTFGNRELQRLLHITVAYCRNSRSVDALTDGP